MEKKHSNISVLFSSVFVCECLSVCACVFRFFLSSEIFYFNSLRVSIENNSSLNFSLPGTGVQFRLVLISFESIRLTRNSIRSRAI